MNRRNLLLGTLAAFGSASLARAQEFASSDLYLVPPPEIVPIQAGLPAGEIHIDPNSFSLYLTQFDGTALRYMVGIGRPGLYEPGTYFVGAKKEWPSWKPTPDMVEREPELYAKYADEGMPGGPGNPLGARALYLFTEDRGDTFLRIHGTDRPDTIGQAVSNGCARLVNDQIIDLYDRVPEGAPVYLYPHYV
jgi:lipoprotein-anchoring transpeptidase ErfK/SrfK